MIKRSNRLQTAKRKILLLLYGRFLNQLETGELQLVLEDDRMDVESFLNDLSNGTLTSSGVSDKISIYDAEGSKL